MNNRIKYTVIIPTLNEEKHIAECIENVKVCLPEAEIIVSDGGSTDNTVNVSKDKGATILFEPNGRGKQLNIGAENSNGEIILFLHADTQLPKNCTALINQVFENDKTQVAVFKMKFDVDNRILNFYSWFTRFDSIFTSFGDCGIVVRKSYFISVNKFPEWKLFEDVHFLRNARRNCGIKVLPGFVTTSARRFLQNGFIKTQLRNFVYIIEYLITKDTDLLYYKYNKMKNYGKNAVIVFSKYPKEGKVKTRLAKTLGKRFAVDFYKICAEHTFDEILKTKKTGSRFFLFYSDEKDKQKVKKWTDSRFLLFPQTGTDLGKKMENAFKLAFKNDVDKCLIIGTDLPDISSDLIKKSFDLLDENDIVIGPATDGGYYLLGMKKLYKNLFKDMPWSTEQLYGKTLSVLNELDLHVSVLPQLSDIDTEMDLKNWINKETHLKSDRIKTFVRKTLFNN